MDIGEQASFGPQGAAIYNALKSNPNLFLMLCGHKHGEGKRKDTDMPGEGAVQTVLADYQGRSNGGDGWLRILTFSPVNNEIRVKTYSPTLNKFETDSDSQFTIPHRMESSTPFVELETVSDVPSGGEVAIDWADLSPGSTYQWYVETSDGDSATKSSVWTFKTKSVH